MSSNEIELKKSEKRGENDTILTTKGHEKHETEKRKAETGILDLRFNISEGKFLTTDGHG